MLISRSLFVFSAVLVFCFAADVQAEQKKSRASSTPVVEITADKKKSADVANADDPLEPVNRGVFSFNEAVDNAVIEPVARGYKKVVPEWGRDRISNFLDNLKSPVIFVNSVLQGDPENALATFWRFMINTTFGIGGLFDQAEIAGLSARDEDFGQTLGYYGAEPGAYIVLPLLGPTTTRDAVGLVADSASNPFNYVTGEAVAGRVISEGIDDRSELLDITDEIDRTSFDPYSTYKSAYMQRRQSLIENHGDERKK